MKVSDLMKNLLLKIKFKLHVKCFNSIEKFAKHDKCAVDDVVDFSCDQYNNEKPVKYYVNRNDNFGLVGVQYIIDNKPVYFIYGCRTDFQVSFVELMQYMTSNIYMNY